MPRKVVPLENGEIYHIYNRGVDKRNIFEAKYDYIRFYQSLLYFNNIEPILSYRNINDQFYLSKNNKHSHELVEVIAYSLLPNHYHLILKQLVDGGISEFMKRVGGGYTTYFNDKYKRSGSLFQGTFKRVLVNNDTQFNYLFAYVNENIFVHNIAIDRDVSNTSSLHFQGLVKSRVINFENQNYNHKASVALAKDIYKKRKDLKNSILLE